MKYCPICDQNYPDILEFCDVDGATLRLKESKQDLLIGKVIKGRYRVIEKLGEGGMGTVYLAEQVAVSRKVALKWLHSDYARDEEFVRRFRQEAKLAAALNHRNVVTIFDFDQADDGSLYIVMEYVDGKNLAAIVQDGPIEIRRALRMAGQIAEGLTAAHRAGVIHRDVKPENIMVVGPEEEIKLMDFGISRLRDAGGASRLTRSGTIMGTPAYMAPEQIEGGEVSERTDIYSFGIVLYEMLSGAVPFQARTPGAILVKHLQETAAPLRKIRREIPAPVERVVTQALEKDAQRRQSSMQEVVESLKNAQRRAETTETSAQGSLTAPLKRLGLSFGSAAARFRSIFGKGAAATSTKTGQETGQSHAVAAAEPERTVLQAPAILHGEAPAAVPQTALVTGTDFEDKSLPSSAAPVTTAFDKDVSATSTAPEQESGKPQVMSAAAAEATVFLSQTVFQSEEPTIAPQTDLITEIKPVPPRQEFPTTPTGATTVIAQAGETINEMTARTPAPKPDDAAGFRWKWLSVGAVAAVLLAAAVFYQLWSQTPSQNVVVLETKQPEVVLESPKPASSDVVEKAVPNVATSDAVPEREPIRKPEPLAAAKSAKEGRTAAEKKTRVAETKTTTKSKEAGGPIETKSPAKLEPEMPAKEQQTELASLQPIKPAEPPVAPIAPETRLVSLAVLSDRKDLDVNSRIILTVKGKYSDGKESEIKGSIRWESSDGSVAVVNSRGELEARKEGKAQITATFSGLTSPGSTFFVKGVPQPEKAKKADEGIQDLRRRLLR